MASFFISYSCKDIEAARKLTDALKGQDLDFWIDWEGIPPTVVILADAREEFPVFPVWLHVYVPDLDTPYRRALEANGVSVQEPSHRKGEPDPCG